MLRQSIRVIFLILAINFIAISVHTDGIQYILTLSAGALAALFVITGGKG